MPVSLNKKHILILILTVFIAYLPALFNGFVIDDHLFIDQNVFYNSWHNIPRLFEKGCILQLTERTLPYDKPGFFSYRPVVGLTYFLEKSLWGNNPFGYHLTNIIFHCLNCSLVYLIILYLFNNSSVGILSALLFAVHPVQSEVVAVANYRIDMIATFFVLISFICWLAFKNTKLKRYYLGTLAAYFMALFTKESTLLLPLVLITYDCLLTKPWAGFTYYLGFIPLSAFYVWIYIFVFPNSFMQWHYYGGHLTTHVMAMGSIAWNNTLSFFLPFKVHLIPNLYMPILPQNPLLQALPLCLSVALAAAAMLKLWKTSPKAAFFLSWALIFYIPVSGLAPLPNPWAYRFLYLPSIGVMTLISLFMTGPMNAFLNTISPRLTRLVIGAFLSACLIQTLFLNLSWKSDAMVAMTWLERYPSSFRAMSLLGDEYFKAGAYNEAKNYFSKAVEFGEKDPAVIDRLGVCYLYLNEPQKAKNCFLYSKHSSI